MQWSKRTCALRGFFSGQNTDSVWRFGAHIKHVRRMRSVTTPAYQLELPGSPKRALVERGPNLLGYPS